MEHCSCTPHKGSEPTTGSVYLSRNREEEISEVAPRQRVEHVIGPQDTSEYLVPHGPSRPSLTNVLRHVQLVGPNYGPWGLLACLLQARALPVSVWSWRCFQLASLPTQTVPIMASPTCLTDRSCVLAPFVSISVGRFSIHWNMSSSEAGGQPEPHSLDRAL